MLKNYLKVTLRNIIRHKGYSFINILGLAMGMSACVIILLYIQKETSYENMHTKANRTYRVLTIDKALGTHNQRVGITMPALGPTLAKSIPEVEASLRLSFGGQTLFTYGDRPGIYTKQVRSSDPGFIDFFDFPLLQGDPATALSEPFSIILTETLSKQIFGDEDPMGKTLRTGSGNDLKVTGILQDLPDNTHLEFDALGTLLTQESLAKANRPAGSTQPLYLETWNNISMPTYMRLREGISSEGFDEKFTKLCRDNSVSENFDITLQPLQDVHLKSTDIIFDPVSNKGSMNNVYAFAAIAVLILLIATVNYLNLSTARSTQRAKEVGLRKVAGSLRSQLMLQFLGESLLITFIALLLAEPIAYLTLSWLNNLGYTSLTLNLAHNGLLLGFMGILLIVVGVLAGLYPALVLSNYKPVTVLKGSFKSGKTGMSLRRALVVFQFAFSIALICITLVIKKQIYYIQHKDLGYNREQVMVVDMFDRNMSQKLEMFRDELKQHSAFASIAISDNIPGRTFGRLRVRPEGVSETDIWIWSQFSVSPETFPTLGMEIVQGRNFNRELSSDSTNAVLVNETAIKQLGWENPIGRRIYFGQSDSIGVEVIGVVKDFHFIGMHQPIESVVMFPVGTSAGGVLTVRIQPGRIPEALEAAETAWKKVYPSHPFSYGFMDDEFENIYRSDLNTSKIVNVFSGLAIFIACLGLFGLASHTTTQRTKEIGVRKVLGASSSKIVWLLVLDFIKWVAISNLFAWPLAWYASSHWLENFAYRINIDWLIFVMAAILSLSIAILTVGFQAIKAALANPSESLRYE